MAAVDPGAIYNQTLGDLGLQETQTLGKIGEEEDFLKSNIGNAENLITGAEPGTYSAESNRANKGGILTSGANANRKATIATNFAGKRTANQARLTQGLAGFERGRQGAGLTKTIGEHTAAGTRAANEDALAAQFPTVPTPAPLTNASAGVPAIPAGAKPPPGMEFVNGLTVPIGTRTVKPVAKVKSNKVGK